jgi:hypothetical protein
MHIALQKGKVARLCLGEEQIEEAAAGAGGSFDELQIFGAKNNGAEGTIKIG